MLDVLVRCSTGNAPSIAVIPKCVGYNTISPLDIAIRRTIPNPSNI